MVVPQAETRGDRCLVPAELLAHALSDGFQGLEAGPPASGMQADALASAMVDGQEDGADSFGGPGAGGVGAPHLVGPVGRDPAVVQVRLRLSARTVGRQQVGGPHEAQDALPGGPDARNAQASPGLAVALAQERRLLDDEPDVVRHLGVGERRLGSTPEGDGWRSCATLPGCVDA